MKSLNQSVLELHTLKRTFFLRWFKICSAFLFFFVLESVILEHIERVILEKKIPSYKFASNDFIIKIDSVDTLEVICDCTVDLALNGFSVYIFFGQGLSEGDLVPTSNWDKPLEFKTLDFEKVDTFIDVHEVGLTIFSDNDKYNSPRKVTDYIPKAFLLDIENSDI
ncbi:hypothetical protein ACQKND_11935 [Viridibacillus arvi]|uniref:hypothetical protein n=1 Tax=Viridibacillus arvi TaxID=263475 RepID=UPI003CFCDE1E